MSRFWRLGCICVCLRSDLYVGIDGFDVALNALCYVGVDVAWTESELSCQASIACWMAQRAYKSWVLDLVFALAESNHVGHMFDIVCVVLRSSSSHTVLGLFRWLLILRSGSWRLSRCSWIGHCRASAMQLYCCWCRPAIYGPIRAGGGGIFAHSCVDMSMVPECRETRQGRPCGPMLLACCRNCSRTRGSLFPYVLGNLASGTHLVYSVWLISGVQKCNSDIFRSCP